MQSSLFDLLHEDSSKDSDKEKLKQIKTEAEIQQLLSNLSSATINTLRDKVAWVLNHYPETRESDISLLLKFWELFEAGIYNGNYIKAEDLYKLTRLTSISRERARIQNTYKLFVASSEIRLRRGTLSDEEKQKAIRYRLESQEEMGIDKGYWKRFSYRGSNGVSFFKTPKAIWSSFRIAATITSIGSKPLSLKRAQKS